MQQRPIAGAAARGQVRRVEERPHPVGSEVRHGGRRALSGGGENSANLLDRPMDAVLDEVPGCQEGLDGERPPCESDRSS